MAQGKPNITPDLNEADLYRVNLHGADLTEADLTRAILKDAHLGEAKLIRTDFSGAVFGYTHIGDVDLRLTLNLAAQCT